MGKGEKPISYGSIKLFLLTQSTLFITDDINSSYGLVAETDEAHSILKEGGDRSHILDTYVTCILD